MGEVYRARDTRLHREVAIKVVSEHLAQESELVARFEKEARAVAALSHPNILTIYDIGHDSSLAYAVLELLEGETLRVRLSHSSLTWQKAAEVGIAVADGLAAAHSRGIIHRDLKPENIFLTSDGRVKVLDFGLARWKPAAPSDDETSAPTEAGTEPGIVLGTAGYMSPEQIRGQATDVPSDVFSLGCVLFEMVAGRRAFSGQTSAETMAAILKDAAPELSEAAADAPEELSRIVTRCLDKNPEQRFQSARDLAFDLRAVLNRSATSRASSGKTRKSIDSLAVLPLANAGGDPETEYLSDGITETLINSLSRLPDLRVMARSTVFRYKGKDVDPLEAGRELRVRAVLTGRVLQRGDGLVVKAELVDLTDGSQLWGEQYSRKISDIFAVEEEIARQILEALRLKLTGEEKEDLTRRYTESSEAYRLYLKGRFYWNKRNSEGVRRGIEYFSRAIEADPEYALAYGAGGRLRHPRLLHGLASARGVSEGKGGGVQGARDRRLASRGQDLSGLCQTLLRLGLGRGGTRVSARHRAEPWLPDHASLLCRLPDDHGTPCGVAGGVSTGPGTGSPGAHPRRRDGVGALLRTPLRRCHPRDSEGGRDGLDVRSRALVSGTGVRAEGDGQGSRRGVPEGSRALGGRHSDDGGSRASPRFVWPPERGRKNDRGARSPLRHQVRLSLLCGAHPRSARRSGRRLSSPRKGIRRAIARPDVPESGSADGFPATRSPICRPAAARRAPGVRSRR